MSRKRPHRGRTRRPGGRAHRRAHEVVEGTIRILAPGSASVETAEGTFQVARGGVREAMNGDTVRVSLVPAHGRADGPFAYVQSVLVRACETFLGTYDTADPLGVVSPLDARIAHDFYVLPQDESASRLGVRAGDVVSVRILEFPARRSAGVVTIERRVGSASELDLAVEAVIASHGIVCDFGPQVLAEAKDVRAGVAEALALDASRRDLRDALAFTIDPADARDYDDAVFARRTEEGFELFVHIADVTHYLTPGSSMDVEARRRTTSVYLVDRVVPMLPEALSEDVCSLVPGQDRLTMSVRIELDRKGQVRTAEAFCSAIRSAARLTYDEVDALLIGEAAPEALTCEPQRSGEVASALSVLDEIARLRLKVRAQRGAIDFATTETKVTLDEAGRPVGVVARRRTRGTSLVEEAMLLANECVAGMLAAEGVACAYRVHERPVAENLKSCAGALAELGLVHGGAEYDRLVAADPHVISAVLARSEGTGAAYAANALLLRAQRRAIYAPACEGHYALGASTYCHFTSPIRRYPDVTVHRALKWLLAGRPKAKGQGLEEQTLGALCRRCSELERVADTAARDSQKVKLAEYYAERIGERASGVVSGCVRHGLFVTLDDTCAEGFVPTRVLGEEWFCYSEEHLTLTGESTGRVWRLGQRVAVEVAGTDVARGRIDLSLARGRRIQ